MIYTVIVDWRFEQVCIFLDPREATRQQLWPIKGITSYHLGMFNGIAIVGVAGRCDVWERRTV